MCAMSDRINLPGKSTHMPSQKFQGSFSHDMLKLWTEFQKACKTYIRRSLYHAYANAESPSIFCKQLSGVGSNRCRGLSSCRKYFFWCLDGFQYHKTLSLFLSYLNQEEFLPPQNAHTMKDTFTGSKQSLLDRLL